MKKLYLYFILTVVIFGQHLYTNRLINETSLYLQQHAHNPVNWYPWGKEAFDKAKKENKLIFLSLGYSTCHWCHVMEKESFTDEEVAKLFNDKFIAIKVDREEYPQLDRRFQRIYMAVNKHRGGWPLSVFMSPDAKVIHMATYIPKREVYGSLGLLKMLPSLVEFQQHSERFNVGIQKYLEAEKNITTNIALSKPIGEEIMNSVVKKIALTFDKKNGGFSKRPKFPEVSKLELLLDIAELSNNKQAFDMAEMTLTKMAEGGIYDQIGGGFFRYTTDEAWQIPHFEKMLYTNGELIPLYVRLYLKTDNPFYKKIVQETISQMGRHFLKEGLYLSASDADSNGEEGGYFIYAYEEVKKELLEKKWSEEAVEKVLAYLGIEEDGNIDGDYSLVHITSKKVPPYLEETKKYLRERSAKRIYPFVDKKVITAWNAMMIKALFIAGKVDNKYTLMGEARLESLLSFMFKNNILYHQTAIGKAPKQKALLEDYAFLIDTLIEAYCVTYNKKYLHLSEKLTMFGLKEFYRNSQWYLSNDGINALADFDDRYYTSGFSMMLDNLVRLSSLTYNLEYIKIAKESIKRSGAILVNNPTKASKLVHTYLRGLKGEIIIKSTIDKLRKNMQAFNKISYPFMMILPDEIDTYIACRVNSCFAHDKNVTKLIEKINKALSE